MAKKVGRREKLAQKVGRREIYSPVPPPLQRKLFRKNNTYVNFITRCH